MERTYKGQSLLEFPENYIIIDLETTGLDPSYDEIIEVCAIKYENCRQVDIFSTLVKPNNYIDEFISRLTGITNDMLEEAPSISEILPSLYEFIGNSLLVGHNINFDINFLYDNFNNVCGLLLKNNFICTMRLSRIFMPNLSHHRLKDLINYFGLDNAGAHRAINDCLNTNKIFENMRIANATNNTLELFKSRKKARKQNNKQLRNLTPQVDKFNENNYFFDKYVVFTGALARYSRAEAAQIVVNMGGLYQDTITKKTNYLILGNNDYCKMIKDGKSSKQRKAELYISKGQDLQILSENVFYDILDNIMEVECYEHI